MIIEKPENFNFVWFFDNIFLDTISNRWKKKIDFGSGNWNIQMRVLVRFWLAVPQFSMSCGSYRYGSYQWFFFFFFFLRTLSDKTRTYFRSRWNKKKKFMAITLKRRGQIVKTSFALHTLCTRVLWILNQRQYLVITKTLTMLGYIFTKTNFNTTDKQYQLEVHKTVFVNSKQPTRCLRYSVHSVYRV